MDLGLTGKVAVVTGASRGIGRAIVGELLGQGVKVVAGARDVAAIADLADVVAVSVDLSKPEAPGALVQAAVDAHGGVDLLVNNVGAGRLHFDGFASITDEDWQWAFEINFLSAARAIRAGSTARSRPADLVVVEPSHRAGIGVRRPDPDSRPRRPRGPAPTDAYAARGRRCSTSSTMSTTRSRSSQTARVSTSAGEM